MTHKPCRLTGPARMYPRLMDWPGDAGPACCGQVETVPQWVGAEVVRVSAGDPGRALVRARFGGKDYYCWMRQHVQFEVP